MGYRIIELSGRKVWLSVDRLGLWTVSLLEAGGPIICDANLRRAIETFKESLSICIAIRNVLVR